MKEKLETLRAKLSQSDATSSLLYDIRREIDAIFKKKTSALLMQLEVNDEEIEQLQRNLEALLRSNQDFLKALVASESRMSQMKTAMLRTMVALTVKHYRLQILAISNSNAEGVQSREENRKILKEQLKAAEEKIRELEYQLEDILICQTEFDLQNFELEQARMTIQMLDTPEENDWESGLDDELLFKFSDPFM